MTLVVVGDALLDRDLTGTVERLCPDAPVPVVDSPVEVLRPGGAGLAALLAASDGRDVVLVTALAHDDPGRELAQLLRDAGVRVVDLGLDGATPEKVRVRSQGRSLLRLDRGGPAGAVGALTGEARTELDGARAVLVADYGRGVASAPGVRECLGGLASGRTPVVWDPHPRGEEPVAGVVLATPNASEAQHFAPGHDGALLTATTARARELALRWRATAVSITLSGRGALLVSGDAPPTVVPAPTVPCPDPCGAGDRFASAAAGLVADGALPSEAVTGAVAAASAFVAAGGAASVRVGRAAADAGADAVEVVERVRAAGGTVVATGGCFDLLHAGHVTVLQQARALGDCLVVLLNSDASVARLKGPTRPLQRACDRATVLLALACVDAVVVFDEDTPVDALTTLRPDVWAKGGDYAVDDLPEAPVVARWGGQAVVLPYLAGRSTTSLVQEAASRA
ncbi:MAG: putative phosphoheptose isomerase with phosphosugar-binding domain match [Frankiales bacterium]|nr:putative phosphoheptose isomerase with phosphosugar-binding domain match [Frankiales bacterium]